MQGLERCYCRMFYISERPRDGLVSLRQDIADKALCEPRKISLDVLCFYEYRGPGIAAGVVYSGAFARLPPQDRGARERAPRLDP